MGRIKEEFKAINDILPVSKSSAKEWWNSDEKSRSVLIAPFEIVYIHPKYLQIHLPISRYSNETLNKIVWVVL